MTFDGQRDNSLLFSLHYLFLHSFHQIFIFIFLFFYPFSLFFLYSSFPLSPFVCCWMQQGSAVPLLTTQHSHLFFVFLFSSSLFPSLFFSSSLTFFLSQYPMADSAHHNHCHDNQIRAKPHQLMQKVTVFLTSFGAIQSCVLLLSLYLLSTCTHNPCLIE